jgi:hypothetical protein
MRRRQRILKPLVTVNIAAINQVTGQHQQIWAVHTPRYPGNRGIKAMTIGLVRPIWLETYVQVSNLGD